MKRSIKAVLGVAAAFVLVSFGYSSIFASQSFPTEPGPATLPVPPVPLPEEDSFLCTAQVLPPEAGFDLWNPAQDRQGWVESVERVLRRIEVLQKKLDDFTEGPARTGDLVPRKKAGAVSPGLVVERVLRRMQGLVTTYRNLDAAERSRVNLLPVRQRIGILDCIEVRNEKIEAFLEHLRGRRAAFVALKGKKTRNQARKADDVVTVQPAAGTSAGNKTSGSPQGPGPVESPAQQKAARPGQEPAREVHEAAAPPEALEALRDASPASGKGEEDRDPQPAAPKAPEGLDAAAIEAAADALSRDILGMADAVMKKSLEKASSTSRGGLTSDAGQVALLRVPGKNHVRGIPVDELVGAHPCGLPCASEKAGHPLSKGLR
jgi:hypothetical protein